MKAQTNLRISIVLSESILLMKYETRRSRLRISHPAQVDGCGCAFGWLVVLLFYVHGKHLRSCGDGQLT